MIAFLLPGIFLLLFAAALIAQFVVARRQQDRRIFRRFAHNLAAHNGKRELPGSGQRLAIPESRETWAARAAVIFGFEQARPELYRIHPALLIVMALAAAAAACELLALIVGHLALLAAPALWLIFSRLTFKRYRQKYVQVLFKQFPDALAMIVRAVRVGIPVAEAIRAVARENEQPTAGEFSRLADQLMIGTPLDEALRRMADRTGLAEYRFFATALNLQSQTGGNLSETLENLADVIRKRVAAQARGYALAAEARMSANVLSVLPVLLFIALWFMNPHLIAEQMGSRVGHMIFGATLGLLFGGMYVMRLLIQKSLS